LDKASDLEIKNMLLNEKSVGLLILNACQTAQVSERFAGFIPKLIERVPAIVSMRTNISYKAAVEFARGFYLNLAGKTIEQTIQEARQCMFNSNDCAPRDFLIPVLYLGIDDQNRTVGSRYGTLFQKSLGMGSPEMVQPVSNIGQEPAIMILTDLYKVIERMIELKGGVKNCLQNKKDIHNMALAAVSYDYITSLLKQDLQEIKTKILDKYPKTYKEIKIYDQALETNADELQTCFQTIEDGITTINNTMLKIEKNVKEMYVATVRNILKESQK
jgi:CHAT domain-containing protein